MKTLKCASEIYEDLLTFNLDLCILFFSALFIPNGTAITSLSELLWIVGVNNFVLKFVSVIVKIIVILLPATVLLHRKRVRKYFK